MMTDQELLTYAAKFAGKRIDKSDTNGGGKGNTGFDIMGNAVLDWHNMRTWNPLKSDSDAFRLMVKLNMYFTLSGEHAAVAQAAVAQADHHMKQEYCNSDSLSASRRAIVMAAAEIGKGM